MADDSGLTDVVRRAAQVNAKFYKGWMDLSLEYVRSLSEIFGGVGGALQSVSPTQEMDSGAGALVLEGELGSVVRGSFLVSNDLDRAISCKFVGSDFADPNGNSLKVRTTFDPASADLGAGEQRVVGVAFTIDETLMPGVGYAGELSIGGMDGFAVPVVLRRQHMVTDDPADDLTPIDQEDSQQPVQQPARPAQKATKRKPARKNGSRRK